VEWRRANECWRSYTLPLYACSFRCLLWQACRHIHAQVYANYYAPPLIGRGIKRCFCLTSVAYIGPKSRTERPRKTKIGRDSPRHTWLGHHFQGQKVKGQGHQAVLLSTALTRKAAAAVSVGTYSAWESTATLCLLGGARGAWEPTGRGEGRGIYCVATRTACYWNVIGLVP